MTSPTIYGKLEVKHHIFETVKQYSGAVYYDKEKHYWVLTPEKEHERSFFVFLAPCTAKKIEVEQLIIYYDSLAHFYLYWHSNFDFHGIFGEDPHDAERWQLYGEYNAKTHWTWNTNKTRVFEIEFPIDCG